MMTNARALQLARDAFRGSTDYWNANIRPQVEKDLRAFQSRHSVDSKYASEAYKGRSKLYRPKTRATIRKNESLAAEAFFSTLDCVSVTAEDETDDAQQASADVTKALLEYRLKKSIPWFQTVIGAYQDAQAVGTVASVQSWKYNPTKGVDRPDIELIPLENLRYDPAASWIDPVNTSPYIIRLIPMYIKDVKKRMRPGPQGQPAKWFTLQDAQIKSAVRHYDSTRLLREDNRTDSRDANTAITEFTIVWVHQVVIEDEDGIDQIYYTLGTEFLLCSPKPLSSEFAHGRRPFVIGCAIIETHKPYSSSVGRLARDVQTEINEVANQRIDNVKFAMNKRYFVKRNRQVDVRSITRNVPGSVTMLTDPETDVKIIDTPDVTSSSYQEQDRLNLDFDEVTGTFSNGSVQSNRRLNETVGGLTLLTDSANQVASYQLKTFVETWVEPVLRQLILLEQFYETDTRLLALAGKSAQLVQKLGVDVVTDEMLMGEMTLTVNVGMGATNPTQRINNLITGVNGVKASLEDGVLEKYGVNPTEIIKEVFGALGHKDGGRFFKNGEEDPNVTGLKNQVEQLKQQLEQKQPQALVDAQIRKLDAEVQFINAQKVTKGVEGVYAAMQAGEVIASVPQVAPIADKVMQAAGYVTPTPAGIDPNFPVNAAQAGGAPGLDPTVAAAAAAPGGAGPGLVPAAVEAVQSGPVSLPPSGNTSPMFPGKPEGAKQGIETQRADGANT